MKLNILDGVTKIDNCAYLNNREIEEIFFPDSVTYIGDSAFKGCSSLKKIVLPPNLSRLSPYAFSNCKNLEEVIFPETCNLSLIEDFVFSYCKNLKKIVLPPTLEGLWNFSFFECSSLHELIIPSNVTTINEKALWGCGIKKIFLPASVSFIHRSALANMLSLEEIVVHPQNLFFTTIDNKALVSYDSGILIQYALNNFENFFEVNKYLESYGAFESIDGIAEYAFMGSRNLKKISLNSEVSRLGNNSFKNCNKLKKISITEGDFGCVHYIQSFQFGNAQTNISFGFDELIINDGITNILHDSYSLFKNLKKVSLPSTLKSIDKNVFSNCSQLSHIVIPKDIQYFSGKSFHDDTTIIINNKKFAAGLINDYNVINAYNVLSLKNGDYYIFHPEYGDLGFINKDDIINFSKNFSGLKNNPQHLINYWFSIHEIFYFLSEDEKNNCKLDFLKNDNCKFKTYSDSFNRLVEILKNREFNDELFLDGFLVLYLSYGNLECLLKNFNPYIELFFKHSSILNKEPNASILNLLDNNFLIVRYCNILKENKINNPFFYNYVFAHLNEESLKFCFSNFDSNFKRLIIQSRILDFPGSSAQNFESLMFLCKSLGFESTDASYKQKVLTFLTEKICLNEEYPVVGSTINDIFKNFKLRDEIDLDFAKFFMDNYYELLEIEFTIPTFISRIYNDFPNIAATNTSNKGSQRNLSVTISKCFNYFNSHKFSFMNDTNLHIAEVIGKWYDDDSDFNYAIDCLDQVSSKPKNIFNNDYDKYYELSGCVSSLFSYQWLDKSSIDNLLLGKYCNCCAHISGCGDGIMKASMVSPDHQNLVIRNSFNKIIAKSTIYVNREKCYAVFNNVEVNKDYIATDYLEGIYEAFMAGAKAFYDRYNHSFPDDKIEIMTIGALKNDLLSFLENESLNHEISPVLPSPDYDQWSISNNAVVSNCNLKQRVLLKK